MRVVAGHGPIIAAWPDALSAQRNYLNRLTLDLRQAIKKGTGVSKAVRSVAQEEGAKWRLFENYHARNATAGYAELEWDTP